MLSFMEKTHGLGKLRSGMCYNAFGDELSVNELPMHI